MLKSSLKSLALAALLVGTAGAAFAQDIMLRATANSNEQDEDYDGLVVFKNYVENASNGAIGVEIFMGTQLCAKGDECLAGVADGTIDIYISTSGGAAGLFPYIQVLDLPYLMSDDRVAEEVLTGTDFTAKLRAMALADSGDKIRLMTIGNTGGWRNYANTKKRIAAPADLAGLKMRTVPFPPTCRRRWPPPLGRRPRRFRGRNCSPRCRPGSWKARRTASPTSCR